MAASRAESRGVEMWKGGRKEGKGKKPVEALFELVVLSHRQRVKSIYSDPY